MSFTGVPAVDVYDRYPDAVATEVVAQRLDFRRDEKSIRFVDI